MATTTYFDSLAALGGTDGTQVVSGKLHIAKKVSFFARLIQALQVARQRQAEREIRRYAAMHGYNAKQFGNNDLPF